MRFKRLKLRREDTLIRAVLLCSENLRDVQTVQITQKDTLIRAVLRSTFAGCAVVPVIRD